MTIWWTVRWEVALCCEEELEGEEQCVKDIRKILGNKFRQQGMELK